MSTNKTFGECTVSIRKKTWRIFGPQSYVETEGSLPSLITYLFYNLCVHSKVSHEPIIAFSGTLKGTYVCPRIRRLASIRYKKKKKLARFFFLSLVYVETEVGISVGML